MGERRSLSARALILGTIVTVAALGLAIVGAVTFVVQFDRVVAEVDAGLADHVEALGEVADLRVVVEDIGTSRGPPDQALRKPASDVRIGAKSGACMARNSEKAGSLSIRS